MNARRMLIDTAFVQALFNRADQYHSRARLWFPVMRDAAELWITEAILVEIGNAFSATNRAAAIQFIRQVYHTPNIHVVTVDEALLTRAIQLYDQRPDKKWGLTDCISFVVMTDHGLIDALTTDNHFVQAGFVALLQGDPS